MGQDIEERSGELITIEYLPPRKGLEKLYLRIPIHYSQVSGFVKVFIPWWHRLILSGAPGLWMLRCCNWLSEPYCQINPPVSQKDKEKWIIEHLAWDESVNIKEEPYPFIEDAFEEMEQVTKDEMAQPLWRES